jgi:hypothetical protein
MPTSKRTTAKRTTAKKTTAKKTTAKKTTAKKATAKKATPAKLTLADVGWNRAVLQSNSELKSLFNRAVAGNWNGVKFEAELKNTKWFKQSSTRWQATEVERLTRPAQYRSGMAAARQAVINQAAKVGARLNEATLTTATQQFYRQGWTEEQLNSSLSTYVTVKNGQIGGETGSAVDKLRQIAGDNGLYYSNAYYETAAQAIVAGTKTFDDYVNDVQILAASSYPVYAKQIEQGQSVRDIASPYVQRMGALLEIDDQEIQLTDPTIREAISGIDPATGEARAKSLWQFENDLRKDPRWLQTNNARDTMANATSGVLKAWGFGG